MSKKNTVIARIGRFFTFITDRVYRAVANGPIGRLLSAYPAANDAFRRSGVVALSNRKRSTATRTLRRGLAQARDQSRLRRCCYTVIDGICRCSLRALGLTLLTTGFYAALVSWLIRVIWQGESVDGFLMFFALALVLSGVPLLFSGSSVAFALQHGVIPGWLLREPLGLSEDAIKDIPKQGRADHLTLVLFGMVLGALLAVIGPLWLLLAFLALCVVLLVITTPEAGVILLLVCAPFIGLLRYGALWLAVLSLLVLASYACKLMRGTRAFRMELQDLVVLALLLLTLFGGVSVSEGAFPAALLAAIAIGVYFPVVNILSTPHWLLRARQALIFSATMAALLGIFQFILSAVFSLQGGSVDILLWGSGVRAGFDDHVGFAYFMVLAFPFALYGFLRAKGSLRMPTGFACVAIAAATVLSFVQSAWLALFVEVVFLCLLYRRGSFPYLGITAILTPVVLLVMPAAWRRGLSSIITQSTDLSGNRIGAAFDFTGDVLFGGGSGFFGHGAGVLRLLFGLGNGGIEAVCALYTVTPAGEVVSGLNFWLYCLLEGGLLGALIPAVLFFVILQNCFSLLQGVKPGRDALAPLCGAVMLLGALTSSIFQYSWLDPTAMLLFFLLVSIITADARHRRERSRTVFAGDWAQGEQYAELEYHARAAQKNAPAPTSEGEVSYELQ